MTDKQICDRIKGVLSASMMPMEMELECVRFLERCQNDGWVPVAERLPADDVQVLACTKHGKAFSAHCENGRWRVSGSVKITHWMPLPEPPGKDGA